MADNNQKTPVGQSLNRFARKKVLDQLQLQGYALPCVVDRVMGSIVRVSFQLSDVALPNTVMPMVGTEYARPPIQAGCKGVTFAADAYLGGMSGLGGGIASSAQPANLTALVFCPISNSGWTTVDPNAYVIYGPNGVVLRDQASACIFTLTPSGLVITRGGISIALNAGGVTITGLTTINGNLQVNGNINATGTIHP